MHQTVRVQPSFSQSSCQHFITAILSPILENEEAVIEMLKQIRDDPETKAVAAALVEKHQAEAGQ